VLAKIFDYMYHDMGVFEIFLIVAAWMGVVLTVVYFASHVNLPGSF